MAAPRGWPVSLASGRIRLRPLRLRDSAAWVDLRVRNEEWLARWEGRTPGLPDVTWEERHSAASFNGMLRALRRESRLGNTLPFAITYDGQLVGQLTVANVTRGAAQMANIGYWVDEGHAGRGIVTVAVALAVDHCLTEVGLHRVEINIRPENAPSLRVVEKLGLRDEGVRERLLFIAGEWCDHRCFAITAEELGEGLLTRALTSVRDEA